MIAIGSRLEDGFAWYHSEYRGDVRHSQVFSAGKPIEGRVFVSHLNRVRKALAAQPWNEQEAAEWAKDAPVRPYHPTEVA